MKHKEEGWGWMLAVDFFFAGMGGGMLLIAGIADFLLGEGNTSVLGNFFGAIFIAIGACFLILELGRPLQAWRVFMNPRAILTFGAWTMTIAIGAGLIYASFGLKMLPWSDWVIIRKLMALGCIVTGLIVATYPGVLLGRNKARPFWNGPGMMVLFLFSSLVTGGAAHILSVAILPAYHPEGLSALPLLVALLLGFQLLFWIGYLWVKSSGTTEREAQAAHKWLKGDFAGKFKYGFLLIGTVLPLILLLFPGTGVTALGAFLALLGGLLMRLLVVYSGEDRTWLPGEELYRSRLPLGTEEFLKAWNTK
jgi:protein NrfD